jgi:adenosylhomocysteine nucleosidase
LTQVGIVAALPVEARALHAAVQNRADPAGTGRDGGGAGSGLIRVIMSGMGQTAAAAAARKLIAEGATRLMTFGLAGGLDPGLQVGAVIMPREIISADARYETDEACAERVAAVLEALLPRGVSVSDGAIFSTTVAVVGVADKAAAFKATGAVAVDLESASVAAIAAERGIPFVSLRVVVDAADESLPPAAVAASGGGKLRLGRLIASLAMHPLQLGALLRLSQAYRDAVRVMSAVAPAAIRM